MLINLVDKITQEKILNKIQKIFSNSDNRFDKLEKEAEEKLQKENLLKNYQKKKHKEELKQTWKEIKGAVFNDLIKCKGNIIILGPKIGADNIGSKLRKNLKEKLEKHILELYGSKTKIVVYFPEDLEKEFESKEGIVDKQIEKKVYSHPRTKLIFAIWSGEAITIIDEICDIARYPNTARKLHVFVEESLVNKGHFVIDKSELKYLKETFGTVYPVDFKNEKEIIERAVQIFDLNHKWAANHETLWPTD